MHHLQTFLAELFHQLGFAGLDLGRCAHRSFLGHIGEDLLFGIVQTIPEVGSDLRGQAVNDVAGEHDGFLHFKKLLGLDRGQGVLLGFHGAVLQGQIHLGKSNGCGVGAAGLRCGAVGGHIGHADLDALHAGAVGEGSLGGGVASTVVGVGRDLNAGAGTEFANHFLEHRALGVSEQVVAITEDEGVVGDAKTGVGARRKRGAADDHVHRAQGQALVDVGLFAQCGGRKDLDVELAVAALLDFLGGPHRLGVEGL